MADTSFRPKPNAAFVVAGYRQDPTRGHAIGRAVGNWPSRVKSHKSFSNSGPNPPVGGRVNSPNPVGIHTVALGQNAKLIPTEPPHPEGSRKPQSPVPGIEARLKLFEFEAGFEDT